MTYSPLAARTFAIPASQRASRGGARIDRITIHHAASASETGTLATIQGTARTVSYNYLITRAGEIWGLVDEDERAFATAAPAWDRRAVNIVMINERAAAPWPITEATFDAAARLIADVVTRRGVALNRDAILGHGELRPRLGISYATTCPGNVSMDALVRRAGTTPTPIPEGLAMSFSIIPAADSDDAGIWYVPLDGGRRVRIANPDHVQMLERARDNDGSDRMLLIEIDQVIAYGNEAHA